MADEKGLKSPRVCRHDPEVYFRVPADEHWEQLDKEGFTCKRNGAAESDETGVTLQEWLHAIAAE